jgi:hypothetical protein
MPSSTSNSSGVASAVCTSVRTPTRSIAAVGGSIRSVSL